MTDVPQGAERPYIAERFRPGAKFLEILLAGGSREWLVTEYDAEPKYPQPEDRPYVRMVSTHGQTQIMSCRVIDAVDWLIPLYGESASSSHEGGDK